MPLEMPQELGIGLIPIFPPLHSHNANVNIMLILYYML